MLLRVVSRPDRRVGVAVLARLSYALWLLTLGLRNDRLHFSAGILKPNVSVVKLHNVILEVLRFVDDRHVLEVSKKPVGFTVGLIKKLILGTKALQRSLIGKVQVNCSFGFDELSQSS